VIQDIDIMLCTVERCLQFSEATFRNTLGVNPKRRVKRQVASFDSENLTNNSR